MLTTTSCMVQSKHFQHPRNAFESDSVTASHEINLSLQLRATRYVSGTSGWPIESLLPFEGAKVSQSDVGDPRAPLGAT